LNAVLDFNLAAHVLNSLHEALSRFVRGGTVCMARWWGGLRGSMRDIHN
jgi:hypothetical protein